MAQAVSRQLLTADAWVRSQATPRETVVAKVALGQVFLRVLRLSPVNIIPPMLHTYLRSNITPSVGQAGEVWQPSREEIDVQSNPDMGKGES
jgi:hypothetical protein